MTNQDRSHHINVAISPETLEQIQFLADQEKVNVTEMTRKLLAESAEAGAGLSRGSFLREYMYR